MPTHDDAFGSISLDLDGNLGIEVCQATDSPHVTDFHGACIS